MQLINKTKFGINTGKIYFGQCLDCKNLFIAEEHELIHERCYVISKCPICTETVSFSNEHGKHIINALGMDHECIYGVNYIELMETKND